MSKVVIYIASSLDGYIARENDDLSWLESFNEAGEDHGYSDFMKNVGTAIIGARAYEQALKHPQRMMRGVKNYVLSSKPMQIPAGIHAEFYAGGLAALVENIRVESAKNIFVVGGGQVVSSFLNAGLVDELLHFVAPILLGEGIPLYPTIGEEISLGFSDAVPYKTGIVRLRYVTRPLAGVANRGRAPRARHPDC